MNILVEIVLGCVVGLTFVSLFWKYMEPEDKYTTRSIGISEDEWHRDIAMLMKEGKPGQNDSDMARIRKQRESKRKEDNKGDVSLKINTN